MNDFKDFTEEVKDANNIQDVIDGYGFTLEDDGTNRLRMRCCFHEDGNPSLKIYLSTNSFNCFGCQTGGDVINFVMAHKDIGFYDALKILAQRANMPMPNWTAEDKEFYETKERLFNVLKDTAIYYHSQLTKEERRYYHDRGLTDETTDENLLGYAPGEGLFEYLVANGHKKADILKAGVCVQGENGMYESLYKRYTLPHWKDGKIVYMAGRDATGKSKAKYKKLKTNEWVKQTLLGEDKVRNAEEILIPEGYFDFFLAEQLGYKCLSPATIQFSEKDTSRMAKLCKKAKRVYTCNDSEKAKDGEEYGEGMKGAIKICEGLASEGIRARMVILPRPEGVDKVDLNDYLISHSKQEFGELLQSAPTFLAWQLEQISEDVEELELSTKLRPLFEQIIKLESGIERNFYLGKIQKKWKLTKAQLKAEMESVEKDKIESQMKSSNNLKLLTSSVIQKRYSDADITEIIANWFGKNDGRFFVDAEDECYLHFGGQVYLISDNIRFNSLMAKNTDFSPANTQGRFIWKRLQSHAFNSNEKVKVGHWSSFDVLNDTLYINLHNNDGQILKIQPGLVEAIENGGEDGVLLIPNKQDFEPITYIADVDAGLEMLDKYVRQTIPAQTSDQWLIVNWLMGCFLMDLADTLPILKLEGISGGGKSKTAGRLSLLIYGKDILSVSTIASRYAEAARVPLLLEDNVEGRNMTRETRDYLLVASTGVTRRKRKSGTDSGTVKEQHKALTLLTGIEPLDESELINRSYIIEINKHRFGIDGFSEFETRQNILKHRDEMLSAIFKLLATDILPELSLNRKHFRTILDQKVGSRNKERTNEYLSTMAVFQESFGKRIDAPGSADMLTKWVNTQEATAFDTQMETSLVYQSLEGLLREWKVTTYESDDGDLYGENDFKEKFGINFAEDDEEIFIFDTARAINDAIARLAKKNGFRVPFKSAMQFIKRFESEEEYLVKRGWFKRIGDKESKPVTWIIAKTTK